MAGTQNNSGNRSSFGPDFYLNPKEQDLLLNALNSNLPAAVGTPTTNARPSSLYMPSDRPGSHPRRSQSGESPMFTPPDQAVPLSAGLDSAGFDGSPFLDGDLDETNFDWDLNGDLIGGLPGASGSNGEAEHGDKRKSPEDGEEPEGSGKRHESEEKTSKKPGRKPLTSEPTSVSSFGAPKIRNGRANRVSHRSGKPRTEPPSAPSASARRST